MGFIYVSAAIVACWVLWVGLRMVYRETRDDALDIRTTERRQMMIRERWY